MTTEVKVNGNGDGISQIIFSRAYNGSIEMTIYLENFSCETVEIELEEWRELCRVMS